MGSVDDTATFDLYKYEGSDKVKLWHGYLATIISFIFFLCVNGVAIYLGPPRQCKTDTWRWRNTYVSWIHADILGVAVTYCFVFHQEMLTDMILYCDPILYCTVAVSLGYFLYDLMDHVINGKVKSNWEVILHHFCVIWSFIYCVHFRINTGYTIMALLTEINSIFLHARKLMQFNQWPFDHWLYKFVVVLNLITFVMFRLTAVILVGVSAYCERDRLSFAFRLVFVPVMVAMYFINPILFWRLIKSDVLRHISSKKSKAKVEKNGVKNGVKNDVEVNGNKIHVD